MKTKKTTFNTIDEYISSFPGDRQKLLQEVRETIKAAAPDAEERISYGIPTFALHGKYLLYFAGWKDHISIYPIPRGSDTFNQKIEKYIEGKGTLKFPLDKPLPLKLIGQLAKYAVAGHRTRTNSTKD